MTFRFCKMQYQKILVFVILLVKVCASETNSAATDEISNLNVYVSYDVRNCRTERPGRFTIDESVRELEILPGLGFDDLRNLDMGQVFFYNYSTCKLTRDGKYLVPNDVFVLPLQEGHYKFYADFYEHWDNYTAVTSSKVNLGGSLLGVSGSYSREKQTVKRNQVNYGAKTTRVTFRQRVYQVHIDARAELHPSFKSKVYEIAASVQNNDTDTADYLSDVLIRDYGTHYIKSVEAGAVFAKTDAISTTYANNVDLTNITSAATFSFPLLQVLNLNSSFNFGFDYKYSEESMRGYFSNQKRSEIFTIGGAPFSPQIDLTQWLNDVPNRMATIDRSADPIHFAITPSRFPELPVATVRQISDYVLTASDRYYRVNTISGCVDPTATNFNFQANFGDSSSCETSLSPIDMAFGGVFQRCTPRGRENVCSRRELAQVNPLTGDFSCPNGYTSVQLFSGTDSYTGTYTSYYRTCTLFFFCSTESRIQTDISYADYQTFWCVAINPPSNLQQRGYLFGGYFTPTSSNPVTGTLSCPPYFRKQTMARDVTICLSSDYELGSARSVGLGGFLSCSVGNPLAVPMQNNSMFPGRSEWPRNCPSGYSVHLIVVENGCEINVCIEKNAFSLKYLPPPNLPPFNKQPPFIPYITEQLVVVATNGSILVRNIEGQWVLYSRETDEVKAFVEALSQSNNTSIDPAIINPQMQAMMVSASKNSRLDIASIVISTITLATVIAFIFSFGLVLLYCKRQKSKKRGSTELDPIDMSK